MKSILVSRAATGLAAAMIAVMALAAVQDISLKRKPKVGDVSEYKVTATFTSDQGEVTFAQNRKDKVTEIKPDNGFIVESTASETKITFGGNDLGAQPDVTSKSEFGPDGLLKTLIGMDASLAPAGYRIANLHAFKAPDGPCKVGDEIKVEIPADATKEAPPLSAVYKVAGFEKVKDWDTARLTYAAEEKGGDTKGSVKGTVWISTTDGSMVKTDETWKDVQPPGAPFPVSGSYKIERVK